MRTVGKKVGATIVVATVAVAAFAAGRMSSRPFGDVAFERAYESCVESVALEYKDKVKAEFRRLEQEWEATDIARIDGLSTRRSIEATSVRTLKAT